MTRIHRAFERTPARTGITTTLVATVAGCASMPPPLQDAVAAFGRELVGVSAANYAPDYAESVNRLVLTVASLATGMDFASPAATGPYAAGSEQNALDDPYDDPAAYDIAAPPAGDEYAAVAGTSHPTDDPGYGIGTPVVYDAEGGEADSFEPMGYDVYDVPIADAAPTLDVTLLARISGADGRPVVRNVVDGDVLRDGNGDPQLGDKIRIEVRSDCGCYLYVFGIDATGWVTAIHPEAGGVAAPLVPQRTMRFPRGDAWWGLDTYRGVEHLYFVLSRTPRPELEARLAALPDTRPAAPSFAGYTPVSAQLPIASRGLVKVQTDPAAPSLPPGAAPAGDRFTTTMADADLVVTRWFRHE